jgi:hypothetical protein
MASNGIEIKSLKDALEMAKYIAKSPFCPKGFSDEGAVLVALQCAMELGLAPLAGLQNIAVINGRPGIYGDAALALVRASGQLESYNVEYVEGKGDDSGCCVTCKRKGFDESSQTFTVKDAKTAGLWGKAGPWTQYPKRMLMFRARGFLLRDQFGDILKGFKTTEELEDYPDEETRVNRARRVNTETKGNPYRKTEIEEGRKSDVVETEGELELSAAEKGGES